MVLLLPLISFLIGFFAVRKLTRFRAFFAMILAKVLIPFVIIYNMVFYQQGSIWLIFFSFSCSLLMYLIFKYFYKNKLKALCLSYLNMAWLGFPFALAIFGSQASSVMVALYIGGSIFGNICAVTALSPNPQSLQEIIKKVSLSPPVVALGIAAVLSLWDFSAYQNHVIVQSVYQWDKWLMTFTGMCILGMWLSHVKIKRADLIQSVSTTIQKLCLGTVFCIIAFYLFPIPKDLMTFAVMLMFFLLPPAANIVALETHYRGTGESARYIASGTVVSILFIGLYGIVVNAIFKF
ncbi:MAG: permease [Acinetobacter sp.]|nr:permease [Acinetobacter sp.]